MPLIKDCIVKVMKIPVLFKEPRKKYLLFTFDKGNFTAMQDTYEEAYYDWKNKPAKTIKFNNAHQLLHHNKITKYKKNDKFIRFWMDANFLMAAYLHSKYIIKNSHNKFMIYNVKIGFVPNDFAIEMNNELSANLLEYICLKNINE